MWFMPCRGAQDINTIPTHQHLYLGHTHQFPYLPLVGRTHILTHNTGLTGVLRTATTQPLTGEGFKMKFT